MASDLFYWDIFGLPLYDWTQEVSKTTILYAFLFVEVFPLLEIQSAYCLHLRATWNFLITF